MQTALVVDDHEENCYLLQTLLQGNGYEVVSATNGGDALVLARRSAPDIVISDILMPGMDGFTLCREWKADDRLKGIPFVFYTATYTHPNDEKFALSLGADRFIVKPAEPESFLRMIADVLALQQAGRLRKPASGAASNPATETGYLREYNETLVRKLEDKLVELEELNKRLVAHESRLQTLAARAAEAEEAERRRLARELHDQVGQTLSALGLNLTMLQAQATAAMDAASRSRLADSLTLVERTAAAIRTVMADLRPGVLDDYGLVAALQWLGDEMATRTGIVVDVPGEALTHRLAAPVENSLFRIAQEALTNVTKHARASEVTVSVELENGVLCLLIADNGIGFDPAQAGGPHGGYGWGLSAMTERALGVGGRCRIESQPGKGTHVIVEVPL